MDTTDIIKQLTAERDRIDAAIKLLTSVSSPPTTLPAKGKRKPISAAAGKRISEAQRKRWAATNKGVKAIPAKVAKETALPAKKRGMSPAARKRIAAAQKKRWAAIKAAKEAAKKIPAKKVTKKAPAKKTAALKKAVARKSPAVKAKKAAPEKAAAASTVAAPA
jgi:hypothetical protein